MKKRFEFIIPMLSVALLPSIASAQDDGNIEIKPVKIIKPEVKRREVKGAAIDTEMFEVGAYAGFLAVEDFNTNLITGLSVSYHINDRWIAQFNAARSEVERSTFEEVIDSSFLADSDRNFDYMNISAGFNLFPGRSYRGKNIKFNSGVYILAGLGTTEFAGSSSTTLMFGSSYRTVLTDWLTCNLDFRNHVMDREFLGESKTTQNIEFSIGFNILF